MVRKVCMVLLAAFVIAPLALPPQAAVAPASSAIATAASSLRTPGLLQSLNKQVTLQDYYYDNGVMKMLVNNMETVRAKGVLPTSAYVPIAGTVPSSVKNGDRISVAGTVFKPGTGDEESLQNENVAVRLTAQSVVNVVDTKMRLNVESAATQVDMPAPTPMPAVNKYALLIGGGYNPATEGIYFRNGLVAAKQILLSKGYRPENILVLYGNGYVPGGGLAPVSPATKAAVVARFGYLASKVKAGDTVFIMVSTCGGGLLTAPAAGYPKGMHGGLIDTNGDESESYSEAGMGVDINKDGDRYDTVRVDETILLWPNTPMSDDEFRLQVNRLNPGCKMIILMDQSFSGGFIRDLTRPGRIITTSTGGTTFSYNEASNLWDSFTVWWLGAFLGYRPGTSYAIDADFNNDGKVSLVEAFNFARGRSYPPFVAGYEDNGAYPGYANQMPYGGDGVIGLTTYL